jgi:hypothetical protein
VVGFLSRWSNVEGQVGNDAVLSASSKNKHLI